MAKAPPKTCSCKFTNRQEERQARQEFLRQYGDALPESVIQRMTSNTFWKNWVVKCNCSKPKDIMAVAHYEPIDWFLCALKGLAVAMAYRGRGLGTETARDTVEFASKEPQCKVLIADVTYDNTPSVKALKRVGFEEATEFCWAKGEKPADILHLVRFKPTKDKVCPAP